MVERTARDPMMEEIVGALRETRQDAGRVPPLRGRGFARRQGVGRRVAR